MKEVSFFLEVHNSTKREYSKFMTDEKPYCMTIAKQYGSEFFDGDRKFGYGGYRYIPGRWDGVINKIINYYSLNQNSKVLDAGAGKGFFLKDLQIKLSNNKVFGFDISSYAIENSPKELKDNLFVHDIKKPLAYENKYFDLLTSFGVLHNLKIFEIEKSIQEIERISKNKYIWVESYRNDEELFNLQCWAKTCESFFTPDEWVWILNKFGYTGEYEFIYFT